MFLWDVYTSRLILVATMFNLCDENCLWVENLFSILLTEGDWESPAPPLMQLESETERSGFIITSTFVDLKIMNFHHLVGKVFALCLNTFKMTKDKKLKDLNPLPKVSIWGPRGEVSACRERRRTSGGSRRLLIWGSAGRRRMALETVTWAGLKIVHFLASAIFSGTKCSWMQVIGGQQCCCFSFGPWQSGMDEKMTTDVSDGPALARFDGWC